MLQQRVTTGTESVAAKSLSRSLIQLVMFGIVGASGVLANLAISIVLHRLNGGTAHAGDVIFSISDQPYAVRYRNFVWISSFVIANIWNYQLNRAFTFKDSKPKWVRGFVLFLLSGTAGMLFGLLAQWAMTHPGSAFYLPSEFFNERSGFRSREYWSQIISIGLATPINFVFSKYVTFKDASDLANTPASGN
ncbi:hypothetical protein KEM60_01771 [Austwickia sp. TVS 96-490-7B]|uniref:GtrA family protein n=1 Tax=Austwickia sp. TVS 96-490-7B TaxID=2830843 RepID=UPI001C598119|nr:GtrA family protein [Austwickia sp. TVS 96-490-7B]MBW3085571.1 hypothetical protein [Austwickia sp. TVS 96-490-7B]